MMPIGKSNASQDDPEFFLILKDISELEMDSLFEHTRLLRERADSVGRKAREKLGIEEGRPRPLSLSRIEEGDERPAADPLAPKAKQGSEQQATTQVDSGIKDERTSKSLLGRLKSLGRRDSKKESPSPSPLAIATQRPSSMPNMWPSTIPSTIDAVPLTKRSDEGEAEVDEDGDGAESDGALDMPMVAGGEELVKELMDKWTTLGVNGETAEEKGREDKNDI